MEKNTYNIPKEKIEVVRYSSFPCAIYKSVNNAVIAVEVSDGLVALRGRNESREDVIENFNSGRMYDMVHPSDIARIIDLGRAFASEPNGHYFAIYREKLKGSDEYSIIQASGYHVYLPDGSVYAEIVYTDITNVMYENERAKRMFDNSLVAIFDENDRGIAVVDAKDHKLYSCNAALRSIMPPVSIMNENITFEEFFYKDPTKEYIPFERMVDEGEDIVADPNTGKDLAVTVSLTEWEGKQAYIVTVTEHNHKFYDDVTSLPNMNYYVSKGQKEIQHIKAAGKIPLVIYFDILGMKAFNKNHGFESGNDLLRLTARYLKEAFKREFICRLPDDHFLVVTDEEKVTEKIEQVHINILESAKSQSVDIRAGIYKIEEEYIEATLALDNARLACAKVKKNVDQIIMYYEPELSVKYELSRYVSNNIDTAIKNGYIKAYYQPVIRTISGKLCGFEALARWQDPEKGMIWPDVFISALEDTQQIQKLDMAMIEMICKDLRHRLDTAPDTCVAISFNLSRMDFLNCNIYEYIVGMVKKYNIPKGLLNVEITESIMVSDSFIRDEVNKLRKVGFAVWMDDFGSGYSSLNVLKDCEFDELKIDMAFLSSFTDKSKKIIESVVKMAKNLGIHTLAEGVENIDQYEFLKSIGCEKVQGYYFGRPLPKEKVIDNLEVQKINRESVENRDYYDKISKVDFITDKSLAVIEVVNSVLSFLFVSDEYKKTLKSIGTESVAQAEHNINMKVSPMYTVYRSFVQKALESDNMCYSTYIDRGNYMKLGLQCIARQKDRYTVIAILENIEINDTTQQQEAINNYIRQIVLIYDSIKLLNIKEDYVEEIMSDHSFTNFKKHRYENLASLRNGYANLNIHEDEISRYLAFADTTNVAERIQQSGKGFLTEFFRMLDLKTKEYVKKQVTLIAVPKSDGNEILEIVRDASGDKGN